ncbi:MAG TPA: class I SAM-dependent methyltransferase [Pyrinomonadaceae bacterium]|jgi:SAM-dependent methyltransferase
MFFGTRDPFTYIECAACGTVQIETVPNLAPYYANNYYSFQPVREKERSQGVLQASLRPLGAVIRRRAADYYRGRRSVVTNFLFGWASKQAPHLLVGFPEYLKETSLDLLPGRVARILDVGSGAGQTLVSLSHFGYRELVGVDPFVETDIEYGSGVRVLKLGLAEVTGQFDLVLANHTIEHLPEPRTALKEIFRLLKPGRYAVVRIPIVSYAWRKYGTNWVQLDPPRHLFLFTAEKFSKLATAAGFEVKKIRYDSNAFQFWGSEQYVRNVPLMDERSYFVNAGNSLFTAEQIVAYATEATELNARGEGDQAAFYLRKPAL